jgi:photosystem II stability/assembly factor-like uncharacterized protein
VKLFSAPNSFAFLVLLATPAFAQAAPQTRFSRTTEDLRGVSAVSQKTAWASGTHGTYLRTTDGRIWIPEQVPGAEALDFRAVTAFSADEAFLMSAGPGDQSRIYHTTDAGRHWSLQFTNKNPKGFFDSMVFWDRTHGIVLGDPIPDDAGTQKFELLITDDGETWTPLPSAQLPPALEGEGAFAASNSSLAILTPHQSSRTAMLSKHSVILSEDEWSAQRNMRRSRRTPCTFLSSAAPQGILTTISLSTTAKNVLVSRETLAPTPKTISWETGSSPPWKSGASAPRQPSEKKGASAPETPDPNIWFATGGKAARVFHSADRGRTWQVFQTPIVHGADSQGIFSIAFRDATHGVIAGGDYKHPLQDGPNLAFTNDGGATWSLSKLFPQSYYSAVAYDPVAGNPNSKNLNDDQAHVRLFLVGPKFIYDFHPPRDPTRISPPKKSASGFNAVSPYPAGGALVVGPKGSIAIIP